MSHKHTIDTDCMTITRYVLAEQRKHPHAHGFLTQLLTSIQSAVKAISSAVRRAGMTNMFGTHGSTNVQGEEVKKLDVLANELFINLLTSSYCCAFLVSEENETIIEIDAAKEGKYVVCFDPLDGSSNIECLVSIGSIFAIFNLPEGAQPPYSTEAAFQSGHHIVAAGYALYGSATMMVLSVVGGTVNGFMLDPTIGEFVLTDPDMRIPKRGKFYSINEGYQNKWDPEVMEYVQSKKSGPKPYGLRYIGSMVADVHRTIKFGGIFLYPRTSDSPKGKLRMLYECMPLAFIVENAGGKASDGQKPILDLVPTKLHERTPIFLGSEEDVNDFLEIKKKHTTTAQ